MAIILRFFLFADEVRHKFRAAGIILFLMNGHMLASVSNFLFLYSLALFSVKVLKWIAEACRWVVCWFTSLLATTCFTLCKIIIIITLWFLKVKWVKSVIDYYQDLSIVTLRYWNLPEQICFKSSKLWALNYLWNTFQACFWLFYKADRGHIPPSRNYAPIISFLAGIQKFECAMAPTNFIIEKMCNGQWACRYAFLVYFCPDSIFGLSAFLHCVQVYANWLHINLVHNPCAPSID